MASIRTAIELYDAFTAPMMDIINSVNLGLSAVEDLHQTMNSPVDTASIEAARDSINQATLAVQQLDAAMQGLETPASETPTAPTNSATVVLPVQPDVPDPLVDQPAPVDLPVEPEQPEPVQVPVHWQSDNMEVFTSTGVERFEQEVQSANNMLNTLNQTQSRIAAQAAQTDLFPDNAIADMNNMQNRLQAIQQRIQIIESSPLNMGSDTANAELEQLRGQLDQTVQEQEALNHAVENMDVEAANQAYLRLSQTVGNTERYIRDNVDEQGRFNREIEEGTNEANSLMQTIKGAVAAYATIQTLSAALNLSDQLTSTTARLNLMNDNLQTTQDLQNMIYLSAERARGSYQATADAVSKLGLMAGDAFGNSQEIIAFMEQVNKQFTIAGTEAAGADAAMLQLTQAMAFGVLRGEEFNSVNEQASNIIQAIADYLDVPIGSIREMAEEGQITADIVKSAMFAAADETNAKFESMPKTFSQIWTSFQNHALIAFQTVLNRLNDFANSEVLNAFVANAQEAMFLLAGVVLQIFDMIGAIGTFVYDNWSWLSPIIYGVAAALAVYYGALLITKGAEVAVAAAHGVMTFAKLMMAAATMLVTGATWAETTAQYGLNAAMYACPIVWIIILIIALIALFYAAVAAVNKFAGTTVSATGIICGAFMTALAFIGNIFVALWNLAADVFVLIYNLVATVANFIGNVFTDPIGAVCRLFFDLADTVLGILQALASAIDAIFGSNLAGSVWGWRDSLGGWVDDTFGRGEEVMAKMNADDMKLGRFEYGEAWGAGYSFGEGIDQSIANFDPSSLLDTNIPGADDYANLGNYGSGIGGIQNTLNDIAGNTGDGAGSGITTADNTGKMADALDCTDEELKYLRDIAERDIINRFTTAELKVEFHNENNINSDLDIDGIVDELTERTKEELEAVAEGVYL